MNWCNESPLRGENADFWPLSKTIPAICRLAAFLSVITMKKRSQETQTLRAGCSKAEPKIFTRRKPTPWGADQPKFNPLEIVTTFIYKPSLVRIDARNFELLW